MLVAAFPLAPSPSGADDTAAKTFRPSDTRPAHDDTRAAELGIRRYDSRHLRLYTDIEPEIAKTLPPLVDQIFQAWSDYFGPLPPDREGTEFQITGYLMRDRARFEAAGMIQDNLPGFVHGRHRGAEFWMNDQEISYYREHLLLHEATHCFMTYGANERPPLWYHEGMAEYFGCHRANDRGAATFAVMPDHREAFEGFGRIAVIHREIREGRGRTFGEVLRLGHREFAPQTSEPYAWSWAACEFLDKHPHYRDRFREMTPFRNTGRFGDEFLKRFADSRSELYSDWGIFVRNLCYGFDFERGAVDYAAGVPLDPGGEKTVRIAADRGWQSTGVLLDSGVQYSLAAEGDVTLANTGRPWLSHPEGISIDYAGGFPIGRLLAAVDSGGPPGATDEGTLLDVFDIGANQTIEPKTTGTLYLRINDAFNSLADNSGQYSVTIRRPNAQ